MNVAALALALVPLQPQDETMDRAGLRAILRRMAVQDAGWRQNRPRFIALANHALAEVPSMLAREGEPTEDLLRLYKHAVLLKRPRTAPVAILNLARGGTGIVNLMAAEIALEFRDDRARAFLLEGLKRMADGFEAGMALELALIRGAGRSHSPEAGKLLVNMLQRPQGSKLLEIIDALGYLGYSAALYDLRPLTNVKTGAVSGRAELAIARIELLSRPDAAASLAGHLRPRQVTGESWQAWAHEHILHRRFAEARDEIRKEYDRIVQESGSPADGCTRAARLLRTLHELGGKLEEDELRLLHDLGVLPPPPDNLPDEGTLLPRFAAGVWRRY